MSEPKLSIELVPRPCWGNNVRSQLTDVEWDVIRSMVYHLADNTCETCGKQTTRLHAHEVWSYNEKTKVQKLVGLKALCARCHEVKHYGRADIMGRSAEAKKWLMKVNGWSEEKAGEHISEAFGDWMIRSEIKNWKLDIHYLKEFMERIIG